MLATSRQMSTPMMSAPASANRTAWLRPCPRPAPVMNATLPFRTPIASARSHADRQVVETAHEVGAHPYRLAGQLERCETPQDLFELHAQGQPGQVDAKTEMLTVGKAKVPV